MDKTELMENILKQYEELEKAIKDSDRDKRNGKLSLEKEQERYNEAKLEFGEYPLDEYQRQVLNAYSDNVKNYEENLNRIDEAVEQLNKKKEFMSTDKNIQTVVQGLKEIEDKIKQKELDLKRSELDLSEYYSKEDKGGKFPHDFYNEQDAIRKEIKELTNKKEKFEKFLDVLKIGRDKLIKDGTYLEANREINQDKDVRTEKEEKKNIEGHNDEKRDVEEQKNEQEDIENQTSSEKDDTIEKSKPISQERVVTNHRVRYPNILNENKNINSVNVKDVICSVKNGKLTYTISGLDIRGKNYIIEKAVEPKRITGEEKRNIKRFIDKTSMKDIDINLYRILKSNKNVIGIDADVNYLKQVERVLDGEDKDEDDISLTYNLTDIRKADISVFKKWQLKRFARNSEKNGIADYIKPQGRMKALIGRVKQGLLTVGSQEPEKEEPYSREDDVYSTYKLMRDEEGFDFDRFCNDMNLSTEERKTLESYEKVNSSKQSFHKEIKSKPASVIPSKKMQQEAEIKKDKEENQNVHDEI